MGVGEWYIVWFDHVDGTDCVLDGDALRLIGGWDLCTRVKFNTIMV